MFTIGGSDEEEPVSVVSAVDVDTAVENVEVGKLEIKTEEAKAGEVVLEEDPGVVDEDKDERAALVDVANVMVDESRPYVNPNARSRLRLNLGLFAPKVYRLSGAGRKSNQHGEPLA